MSIYDPYPFTNISKNVFKGKHDGEEYLFQPGETKYLPSFLVNGFVNQFVSWAINSEEFGIPDPNGTYDKPKFLLKKRADMEAKLRNDKYKIVPLEQEEIAKKVQEEQEAKAQEVKKFICDICQKEFAHQGALNLHMRVHTKVKVE